MSQIDGFKYYFDYLGLDEDNFLVQFSQGLLANYSGTNHPEFERNSQIFPQEISAATGLNSQDCTHFFLYNVTGSGQGILFSSLQGYYPYSGYAIGITDDNKAYFETYDNNGPVVRVGSHINTPHNAFAVTLGNNAVSFNYFDFERKETESEIFPIQTQYIQPSDHAYLGGPWNLPTYTTGKIFPGTIDSYVYLSDTLGPDTLDVLFSGFYSYPSLISGAVTSGSYYGITGYIEVPFGYSGITGYQTTSGIVGSGINGQPIYQFSTVPLSGFISGGVNMVPQSGLVTTYTTGDSSYAVQVDVDILNSFLLDRIAFLNPQANGDKNTFYGESTINAAQFNLQANYDWITKDFKVDSLYNDSDLQIYLNGSGISNLGYSVTGNIYDSGVSISGDYYLSNFDVVTSVPVDENFNMTYDYIPSGQKYSIPFSGRASGHNETLGVNENSLVFLNGQKLAFGSDYKIFNGNLQWANNNFISGSGILSSFTPSFTPITASGTFFDNLSGFQKTSSRIYHNGARLILDQDYIENSHLDFLKHNTIIENSLVSLYNGEDDYLEN